MTGNRWLTIARCWFADEMVERVFARAESSTRLAFCFATSGAMVLPWQLKKQLPDRVTVGAWMTIEAFVVIGLAAQWYLFFDANPSGARYLLPALASTALPLALVPAAIVTSRVATAVELRTMMLRLTLLSMLLLAPTLTWWLPASNQSWRVVQAGDTLRPRLSRIERQRLAAVGSSRRRSVGHVARLGNASP
jgi:hypothetical protein